MNREAVLCAERLNADPPIFRGCTSTELGVIVLVAVLIWLPLGFLLAGLSLRGQRGELAGRTRAMSPLPGHGYEERRVNVLGTGVWIVWLDMEITETVHGMTVKRTVVRYPLRVPGAGNLAAAICIVCFILNK